MSATPEDAAVAFLSSWKRRDWRGMAETVQTSRRLRLGDRLPARLDDLFGNRELLTWELDGRTATPTGPALVELRVRVRWRLDAVPGRPARRETILVNVVRENELGRPVNSGGTWGVNETSALRVDARSRVG